MNHGSLFSGIGGFDLAAEWMGWNNIFHCEWNDFGQRVLKYYWPNAISYGDITKTDFSVHRGQIDIITGGFPCQPFSAAGKRKGKDDDRYLWPEMLRAIREIRPVWVIGENVGGIISMVQPGSEIEVESQATFFETNNKETILEQEYVIETICSDLEREGYSVQPILIPACGVGAPHRRDRVWFVAHHKDDKRHGDNSGSRGLQLSESLEVEKSQRIRSEKHKDGGWLSESINAPGGSEGQARGRSRSYQSEQIRQQEMQSTDCESLGKFTQQGEGIWSPQAEGSEQMVCSDIYKQRENSFGVLQYKRGSVCSENDCRESGGTTPNPPSQGREEWQPDNRREDSEENRTGMDDRFERLGNIGIITDTGNQGLQRCKINRGVGEIGTKRDKQPIGSLPSTWENFPTQPPVCSRNDGISSRLVGITISKHRNESIKAYGNAIVPQIAFELFKAIEKIDSQQ